MKFLLLKISKTYGIVYTCNVGMYMYIHSVQYTCVIGYINDHRYRYSRRVGHSFCLVT